MRPLSIVIGLLFIALGATAVISGATDADWWWWVLAATCGTLGVTGLVLAVGSGAARRD